MVKRNKPNSKGIHTIKFRREKHFLTLREKKQVIAKRRHTKLGNPFICDEAEEDNEFTDHGVFLHAQIIHLIQVQTSSL